jgi:hypothetical protein
MVTKLVIMKGIMVVLTMAKKPGAFDGEGTGAIDGEKYGATDGEDAGTTVGAIGTDSSDQLAFSLPTVFSKGPFQTFQVYSGISVIKTQLA